MRRAVRIFCSGFFKLYRAGSGDGAFQADGAFVAASEYLRPGLVVALVVIFQPELRMALAKLGSRRHLAIFGITLWGRQDKSGFIESLCATVSVLASKRHGALIALQRTNKLHSVVDTGTKVDGLFSKELVGSIFFPKTPLHDGGLIVDQERIVAAGCIFLCLPRR